MRIRVTNKQKEMKIQTPMVRQIVKSTIEAAGVTCDEVSVYFIDTKTMCRLHADFFDDPSPTDCISFPLDDDDTPFYRVLGEIFVCPATAIEYSTLHCCDPYEELTLYLIHGLLHLFGYDDIEEHERRKMRKAEKTYMTQLRNQGLILRIT